MNSNKRKKRKIFILFVVIVITTVVLIVGTYAWFVGVSTVNVGQFNVSISTDSSLQISLDGDDWKKNGDTLTISKDSITKTNITGDHTYSTTANKWSDKLIPLSSVGDRNRTTGRVKFFEESSLSSSPGGYKLIADQVDNTSSEADGYIAFDLFIKNGNGDSFDSTPIEDVFLTKGSYARANLSGSVDYGAANSLRVGFFEVNNIKTKTASLSDIRNLACASSSLCDVNYSEQSLHLSYDYANTYRYGSIAGIWEPNHTSHTTNVINYFNSACKKRELDGSYLINTYNENNPLYEQIHCLPLSNGYFRKTYPIRENITSNDNVDIYDNVNGHHNGNKIYYINTYKDSDFMDEGSDKRPLFKLAGNSITKVRVYIWIEGQDIDNYDLIAKEPNISIKFGFTKDRYGIDSGNTATVASSFANDSWKTIQYNVQHNNTDQYNVGDTKTVYMDNKEYVVRLANKSSSDSICSNSSNSKTACGFVVEFIDTHDSSKFNQTNGYGQSEVHTYLTNTFYPKLPKSLQDVIIDTKVVYGTYDGVVLNVTDKLYLLSGKEIYNTSLHNNVTAPYTRQLDYYSLKGVSLNNNDYMNINNRYFLEKTRNMVDSSLSSSVYWLRDSISATSAKAVYALNGNYFAYNVSNELDVMPAFRIG